MTNEEVGMLLHFIGKAYRVDYGRDDAQVWEALLAEYDAMLVMNAARHWSQHEQFPPVPAKLVALVEQQRDEQQRKELQEQRKAAAHRCDGARWIAVEDGRLRPCATCNPALFDVWSDGDKWARYMAGAKLQTLVGEHLAKVDVAPCPRPVEPVAAPADMASVERLRAADWANNRRDLQ